MIAMFSPLWLTRFMIKGLLIFPLEGHSGHGSWALEDTWNHYIHHSKFNWNYGSSPMWYHICGTNYDPAKLNKKRAAESLIQAKLVGATIAKGLKGEAGFVQKERKKIENTIILRRTCSYLQTQYLYYYMCSILN